MICLDCKSLLPHLHTRTSFSSIFTHTHTPFPTHLPIPTYTPACLPACLLYLPPAYLSSCFLTSLTSSTYHICPFLSPLLTLFCLGNYLVSFFFYQYERFMEYLMPLKFCLILSVFKDFFLLFSRFFFHKDK